VEELIIGAEHRQARHAQLGGQGPGGRHLIAGAQAAVEDGAPETVVHLAVQRVARGAVDGEEQIGHGHHGGSGAGGMTTGVLL
jgi:hypothetical protein